MRQSNMSVSMGDNSILMSSGDSEVRGYQELFSGRMLLHSHSKSGGNNPESWRLKTAI